MFSPAEEAPRRLALADSASRQGGSPNDSSLDCTYSLGSCRGDPHRVRKKAAEVMGTIECAAGLVGTQEDAAVEAFTRVKSFDTAEAATAAVRTSRASEAAV